MSRADDLWFLHVSDIHVGDSDDRTDFFCKDYYEENIDCFVRAVRHHIRSASLAGIIFTGDFVYAGATENLSHASKVFASLCEKAEVPSNAVVAIHGNHDFKREHAKSDYSNAVAPVQTICLSYGNALPEYQNPFGALYNIGNGAFVLAVDSLINATNPGEPGKPSDDHEQILADAVQDCVNPEDILIIASHFPLSDFGRPLNADGKVWRQGVNFANRIAERRNDALGPNIWLSGDWHVPDKPQYIKNFTCLLGGHLSGRRVKSNQDPGTILFRLQRNSLKGECHIADLQRDDPPKPTGGNWIWRQVEKFHCPRLDGAALPRSRKPLKSAERKSLKKIGDKDNGKKGPILEYIEDAVENVTGGEPPIERKITETVTREELYRLGRFEIAKDRTSLGWVSIGPLLAGTAENAASYNPITPLLPRIAAAIKSWILGKKASLRIEDSAVILLGVDCWGAVIASQVSVMTGWRNFCVAGRGEGAHHTPFELPTTPRVLRETAAASLVVLIIDVIASGHTIHGVRRQIDDELAKNPQNGVSQLPKSQEWLAATILIDEETRHGDELDFIQAIGYACKSLRLPLIDSKLLPNKDILPPDLCFRDSRQDA